jgi:histidinol dehydrogenase
MLRRVDLRGLVDASGGASADRALLARLPRPQVDSAQPAEVVGAICDEVRDRGDAAVRDITRRVDGCRLDDLVVGEAERKAALGNLDPDLRSALELAADRVRAFHASQMPRPHAWTEGGVRVDALPRPVDRAGAYAPGGAIPLISTVLMTVLPAKAAGVAEVVVATAPDAEGRAAAGILAAAELCGVSQVVVGNAPALVAAMAYGTESVPQVDVIVGPGGTYTAQAKREVAARGLVGVPASFAGPSEVAVLCDGSVSVELAALDLAVQVEHGPDGLAWLICWSEEVAAAVEAEVIRVCETAGRSDVIRDNLTRNAFTALVDGPREAIAVANAVAPEHLELMVEDAQSLLDEVRHAGTVFCGPWSPASVGDYVAGPSHVLPTFGSARYGEALGVNDFLRTIHAVTVEPGALDQLGPAVATLARAEGLDVHARSVERRMELRDGGHG